MQDLLYELKSLSPSTSLTEYERILTIAAKYGMQGEVSKCFKYMPGWLFIGLDFQSLEDRISALTTKDPAKLAVYLYGFDGHCLRAQTYFSENMPDIQRAPEGAKCYKATMGSQVIYFHEHEVITYMGKELTGAELVKLIER